MADAGHPFARLIDRNRLLDTHDIMSYNYDCVSWLEFSRQVHYN